MNVTPVGIRLANALASFITKNVIMHKKPHTRSKCGYAFNPRPNII